MADMSFPQNSGNYRRGRVAKNPLSRGSLGFRLQGPGKSKSTTEHRN
jgi:hypothetical protein